MLGEFRESQSTLVQERKDKGKGKEIVNLSGCSFYGCKIRSFSDFVFENIHSFYFSP